MMSPSSPAFTSIHLIATGVSCFLGAGLLSFLIYVYCQRFHKPSQESAVIHPTTPNHLNYKGNTTPKNEKYTPMEFKVLNVMEMEEVFTLMHKHSQCKFKGSVIHVLFTAVIRAFISIAAKHRR